MSLGLKLWMEQSDKSLVAECVAIAHEQRRESVAKQIPIELITCDTPAQYIPAYLLRKMNKARLLKT
jgi:hypothetical protein